MVFLGSLIPASAQWNLPYIRPPADDLSARYSNELAGAVQSNPGYFASEMQRAWTYYKATFMLGNGLVNHRSKLNGNIIGADEAVSEGQGYGLLLAVLMNDQPTFNRIFEAANLYMWRSDKQSYFIWNWPSGGQGSATDADLDIGLALVFADELQKKALWQPYDKAGVTYKSRAMDVIRSIRAHMTAQDYLLPGDSWGGDGLNNLNPSYFATANLKVFDAYQSEVDFTPVIATCYQVLKKSAAQYQKGQAPDWITKDGGHAGRGGMDMLDDGIRAPYRIGLDALWFGDPSAMEFCRNSKVTLNSYANPDSRFVLNQMGLYTEAGQLISGSAAVDHMAMWATAALASGDSAFSHSVIGRDLILRIVGDKITGAFGSTQLSEPDFYYKQSLGMLGFAAITGQFPNILADMKGNVVPLAVRAKPYGNSTLENSLSPKRAASGSAVLFGRLPDQSGAPATGIGIDIVAPLFDLSGRRVFPFSEKSESQPSPWR